MKIIRQLIAVCVVMAAAVVIGEEDNAIYWTIFDPTLPSGESVQYDYATIKVKYENDSTFYDLYDFTMYDLFDYTSYNFWYNPGDSAPRNLAGMFDSATAESFFVQLYQGEAGDTSTDTLVAWNTIIFDRDLYKGAFGRPTFTPSNVMQVSQVIPEPTSGLLLLFGVAGLALKRRRQAV